MTTEMTADEKKLHTLDKLVEQAYTAVQEARKREVPHVTIVPGTTNSSADLRFSNRPEPHLTRTVASFPAWLNDGQWAVQLLWIALDEGFLSDMDEADFHMACLYRPQKQDTP